MLNKVVVVSGGGGRLERIRIAMLHPSSLLFLLPSSKKKVIMLLVLQGRVVPHCCSFSSRGTDGHAQQELESRWMVASSNAQELEAGSRMYYSLLLRGQTNVEEGEHHSACRTCVS
jgi:hypothetical protein